MENNKHEKDQISGVETTGHEWDGIKELNNPAPRWWLWIFYVTIVWSIGYCVVYPSWPTLSGSTQGSLGWTQYSELKESQKEIKDRHATFLEDFSKVSFAQIQKDPRLHKFAIAGGKSMFKDNCSTCHGTGGSGAKGYPNLNDDDWLWGGSVEEIYRTIKYGIRSGHDDGHESDMPAFGSDDLLTNEEIFDVAKYVMALSHGGEVNVKGKKVYTENCSACHGLDAKGDKSIGAPNLSDVIWLYGGDEGSVIQTISRARAGVMPHFIYRLSDDKIRQLAIYVHSLGGGE